MELVLAPAERGDAPYGICLREDINRYAQNNAVMHENSIVHRGVGCVPPVLYSAPPAEEDVDSPGMMIVSRI